MDLRSFLTSEDAPVAREVTIGDETQTVWFRAISAGQRERIVQGLKLKHVPGTGAEIEIDLGANEKQRQMLVMYSVCDERGQRLFKSEDEVKKIPQRKLDALARIAEEVNADGEPGKA